MRKIIGFLLLLSVVGCLRRRRMVTEKGIALQSVDAKELSASTQATDAGVEHLLYSDGGFVGPGTTAHETAIWFPERMTEASCQQVPRTTSQVLRPRHGEDPGSFHSWVHVSAVDAHVCLFYDRFEWPRPSVRRQR